MDVNDKTLKLFKGFINDLINVFPEHKTSLENNYKDILKLDKIIIDDNDIISEFLKIVDDNSDDITNKNEQIFTDNLFIIKDISMKTIWDSGISEKTKKSIWDYLQSFCLINITINSNDKINEVLKNIESNEKVKDKKTVKEMKKIQKINESLKEETPEPETPDKPMLDKKMLENTAIGNLAQEISNDLNISDDNPAELFKPENMMNMFQKINSTLTSKIDNKEIDMNNLFGEASGLMNDGMMENMMGMFGNMMGPGGPGGPGQGGMPDLSSMMNMMGAMQGQSGGQGQAGQGQAGGQEQSQKTPQSKKNNHDPDVVKERLRKKLESKK
jgi:hypothetical protein